MIYDLETMEETDLLHAILEIDVRMQNHFVDNDGISRRLDHLIKSEKLQKVKRKIEELGLTSDDVLNMLSADKRPSIPITMTTMDDKRAVTIVDVSDEQRQVIKSNVKQYEKKKSERQQKVDDKLQALIDKFNAR